MGLHGFFRPYIVVRTKHYTFALSESLRHFHHLNGRPRLLVLHSDWILFRTHGTPTGEGGNMLDWARECPRVFFTHGIDVITAGVKKVPRSEDSAGRPPERKALL